MMPDDRNSLRLFTAECMKVRLGNRLRRLSVAPGRPDAAESMLKKRKTIFFLFRFVEQVLDYLGIDIEPRILGRPHNDLFNLHPGHPRQQISALVDLFGETAE